MSMSCALFSIGCHTQYHAFMLSPKIDRLQGENPLAQQNHDQSTHAYDKHLLLKIGKSNSPPGHCKSHSRDKTPSSHKLSTQSRGPSLFLRPVNDQSSSLDPITKWMASPTSAVSPGSRNSWREYSMDSRSSSSDTPSQAVSVDPDLVSFSTTRSVYSTSQYPQRQSPEDTRSRSERGSYDSGIYTNDVDYASDETSLGSSVPIEERPRPSAIHHGVKRRALSPPSDMAQDSRVEAPTPRLQRASDVHGGAPRQPYRAGSLSSTASSVNYNSHASSNISSLAASSATSLSSINIPTSREPGHHLPLSQAPRSVHGTSIAILPFRQPTENPNTAMSAPSPMNEVRTPPARIGNHYICSCCPKKPKKFDSEEQLRSVRVEIPHTALLTGWQSTRE